MSLRVYVLLLPFFVTAGVFGTVWVSHWASTGNWRLIPPRDRQSLSLQRHLLVLKVLILLALAVLGIGLMIGE